MAEGAEFSVGLVKYFPKCWWIYKFVRFRDFEVWLMSKCFLLNYQKNKMFVTYTKFEN